jgi:hypothetical protein
MSNILNPEETEINTYRYYDLTNSSPHAVVHRCDRISCRISQLFFSPAEMTIKTDQALTTGSSLQHVVYRGDRIRLCIAQGFFSPATAN